MRCQMLSFQKKTFGGIWGAPPMYNLVNRILPKTNPPYRRKPLFFNGFSAIPKPISNKLQIPILTNNIFLFHR